MYYIDPRYDGTFLLSTHKHYTAYWCPGHVMLQGLGSHNSDSDSGRIICQYTQRSF